MKKSLQFTVISLIFVLASACATIQFGTDFNPKDFEAWVKRGETTQAQVKGKMGEPTSTGAVVEMDGTYYTRWTYYYGKGKIHKLKDANLKVLEIRFNSHKQVVSFNWSAPNETISN
ncbi:MAG: hypothetical protein OEZ43_13700 [Gammaproteobacteria bacterium]|nr:hypothetical protein [Gammaproteobacteria bacterium]